MCFEASLQKEASTLHTPLRFISDMRPNSWVTKADCADSVFLQCAPRSVVFTVNACRFLSWKISLPPCTRWTQAVSVLRGTGYVIRKCYLSNLLCSKKQNDKNQTRCVHSHTFLGMRKIKSGKTDIFLAMGRCCMHMGNSQLLFSFAEEGKREGKVECCQPKANQRKHSGIKE